MSKTDTRKKILVVDDDKMNVVVLANYLKPPYEIIVAQDGASALDAAKKHVPDMILLDIIMPEMNGFDVFAKLKDFETTRDIPVIFISGLDTTEIMLRGLKLGAVDYITKPFDKTAVKAKIDSYFKAGK
jgi:PleD family two-component response regulator